MKFDIELSFYKYQGTGNDFILIDNRSLNFPKENTKLVNFLCDRKFGIGADGLILLEKDDQSDFKMVYYNADGNLSTMCGNGGRCLVAFANKLGIIEDKANFMAVDGHHHATIEGDMVTLQMIDVLKIEEKPKYTFLNTGSPHHVQTVEALDSLKVKNEGAKIRYGIYGQEGANINFVEAVGLNTFAVRTYERGVEDETLSCGTGVTAVALAMHHNQKTTENQVVIETKGGRLEVSFKSEKGAYSQIQLKGPATFVFKGNIIC